MPIRCTVEVVDVNGSAIPNASVRVGAAGGATGADGRWSLSLATAPIVASIVVEHPNYVSEYLVTSGDLRTAAWSNPLASRTLVGDDDVRFTFRLGRLDTCPVRELSDAEIKAIMAQKDRDPHAARVWYPPRFPSARAYHGHWNDLLNCYVASAGLLPEGPVSETAAGWARFERTLVENLLIGALGRFYWLEYAAPQSDPKYVVAVFSPNLSNETPLSSMDFAYFLSPHTLSYTATYPYGLIHAGNPFQEYLLLGKKYLLDEFYFVPQLLARRNRAITVMPICRHGDWGPFQSGEGVLRLLREVALFLHRQHRTSAQGLRPPNAGDELAGPNLRKHGMKQIDIAANQPIPAVGKVAVSCFSTGAAPMKHLLDERNFGVAAGSANWGVPAAGVDPRRLWNDAFRELWDLDGFHPDTGGWDGYLDQVRAWFNADDKRVYRSYHSMSRVPPDPLVDPHPVWKHLKGSGIALDREQRVPSRWARVLQNARWTSLRMSDSYVNYGPGSDRPLFLDAHHTTPRIGFSHAAGVTEIGK